MSAPHIPDDSHLPDEPHVADAARCADESRRPDASPSPSSSSSSSSSSWQSQAQSPSTASTGAGASDGDSSILDLLRFAGHRPQPAAARAEQAFAVVEQEWRRTVRLRRLRRSLWRLGAVAAAAALAIAVGAAWMTQRAASAPAARPAPPIVATLLALHGPVHARIADARGVDPRGGGDAEPRQATDGSPQTHGADRRGRNDAAPAVASGASGNELRAFARAGESLAAGVTLDSGPRGRAVLRLAGGASVRMDEETRVSIDEAESLTLERGAIYIDSQAPRGLRQLRIRTPHGLVRDIGTQFEVRTSATEIRIRVREGEVRLDRGSASAWPVSPAPSAPSASSPSPAVPVDANAPQALQVTEAEELRVAASGAVTRRTMPTRGAEWGWIETIAPPFTIEGASLERFLAWVSREQNWRWRYADDAAARYGATVVLHGSIEGLTPAQALDAVLATCDMSSRLRDGHLVISRTAD